VWNRDTGRSALLIAAMATMLVLGGCEASATTTQSVTTPRASPTATPLPTINPSSPILGGTGQAFYTLYSKGSVYENGWYVQGPYGATWTGIWGEDGATTYPTPKGGGWVTGIQTAPKSGLWTVAQAQAMIAPFLPPDAKLLDSKQVYFPNSTSLKGIERVYSSTLLARTLPAEDFKDANEQPAQAGVFYAFLIYSYNGPPSSLIQWCNLGVDEGLILSYYRQFLL
jgi:hypothetical protein